MINSSPQANPTQSDPSGGGKMQRASTIILQNRTILPTLQLNVGKSSHHHHGQHQQHHNQQAAMSPTGHKSGKNANSSSSSSSRPRTGYLKKAHTLAQNATTSGVGGGGGKHAARGHIPVSNSMKNLEKIKAHMSSNSLSTLAHAQGGAGGGAGGAAASATVASAGHSGASSSRQEFFKRVFRNHSSSVESPTTTTASPPQSTILINGSAAQSPGSQQAPPLPNTQPKSPKFFSKQQTKVNRIYLFIRMNRKTLRIVS